MMFGIGWKTFFFMLFVINLTGLLIILIMNGISIYTEGYSSQSINRFFHNSGMLFIKSQGVIADAVNNMNENPDMPYNDLVANQRYIIGGSAFTILMIMVVFSALGKVFKRAKRSSWYTIELIIASVFIVMILQVAMGFFVFGEFLWPFNGWWKVATNLDVVWSAFTRPAPGMIVNATIGV